MRMTLPTREHGEAAVRNAHDHAPPAEFEHEAGTWAWTVTCAESPDRQGLNIEVSASGGGRWVAVDDGGEATYLDEPRVRGLLLSLQAAYARAWPETRNERNTR